MLPCRRLSGESRAHHRCGFGRKTFPERSIAKESAERIGKRGRVSRWDKKPRAIMRDERLEPIARRAHERRATEHRLRRGKTESFKVRRAYSKGRTCKERLEIGLRQATAVRNPMVNVRDDEMLQRSSANDYETRVAPLPAHSRPCRKEDFYPLALLQPADVDAEPLFPLPRTVGPPMQRQELGQYRNAFAGNAVAPLEERCRLARIAEDIRHDLECAALKGNEETLPPLMRDIALLLRIGVVGNRYHVHPARPAEEPYPSRPHRHDEDCISFTPEVRRKHEREKHGEQ